MHIKPLWSYINKGLLAILSFLVISTILCLVYLTHTLLGAHDFSREGAAGVSTAFVLQDLMINLQDTESSARGYALTNDDSFLTRYNQAKANIPADMRTIQTDKGLLVTPSEEQKIADLVNKKLAFSEQIIQVRRDEGFDAAQALIDTYQGETLMNQLRTETDKVSSISLQNLGPMRVRTDANLNRALAVAGAMAVLVLGTCLAVAWYFQRAILRERALDSTKNEFLSLASHQLRTPATNVKQYLGLLLDGYMGDISNEQRKALEVAYKNNESEITIMNNLLEVAKLDLERIQLHKKVTNITAIARRVVTDHTARAKESGQTIRLKAQKQVMASVDEAYVKGVLDNLVDNAIKYSKEGSRITVTVSREQDNVSIQVRDQGLGIRKRDFSKLFNKFSRLDNEFSANSQGSGLGLYWVKQVVKLHRGNVHVSSHEGRGSTFTVSLPVR